jgi:hypothetical protein
MVTFWEEQKREEAESVAAGKEEERLSRRHSHSIKEKGKKELHKNGFCGVSILSSPPSLSFYYYSHLLPPLVTSLINSLTPTTRNATKR